MLLLALLLTAGLQAQEKSIVAIDFFGYAAGDDLEAVRKALPFRKGDLMKPQNIEKWKVEARKAARAVTKRQTTDVVFVCCNDDGWVAYLGLGNTPASVYRPQAVGAVRLPEDVIQFDRELTQLWMKNVMAGPKGDGGVLQKKLAELREVATRYEPLLLDAAAHAGDSTHRAAAAFALGHGLEPGEARIAVLVDAASDRDGGVRNNAARGLIEWATKEPDKIPVGVFLKLVQSGTWTDRNKGSAVLRKLAETKPSKVLAAIRQDSGAVTGLKEMAGWQWDGHATVAREILREMENGRE